MHLAPIAISIVELLCSGHTAKQVEEKLGISPQTLNEHITYLRLNAALPKEKRTYQACKGAILDNLEKMKAAIASEEKARAEYLASLHQFGF